MRYLVVKYIKTPNGNYNETITVEKRVKNLDLQEASVILDYKDQKVVKFRSDRTDLDRSYDNLNNFFKGHYPDVVNALEAKYQAIKELSEEVVEAVAKKKAETR